jgi:hypothetical protein
MIKSGQIVRLSGQNLSSENGTPTFLRGPYRECSLKFSTTGLSSKYFHVYGILERKVLNNTEGEASWRLPREVPKCVEYRIIHDFLFPLPFQGVVTFILTLLHLNQQQSFLTCYWNPKNVCFRNMSQFARIFIIRKYVDPPPSTCDVDDGFASETDPVLFSQGRRYVAFPPWGF